MKELFKPDLTKFPHRSGCYLMYDKADKVIYVGKAVDLRKRVASYFQKTDHDEKTNQLLRKVAKLDFMVTDTEMEALLLENELIKKYMPHFNILLRDDKSYQYIKIDFNDPFPVVVVARARDLGAMRKVSRVKYFGPYTSGLAIKQTTKLIEKVFPICTKAGELNKRETLRLRSGDKAEGDACLNWHLGRCWGPCTGKIGSKEYQEIMQHVVRFLSGDDRGVLRYLEERMKRYSQDQKFEEALKVRDQIDSVQTILEKQKVAQPGELSNQDFWGWIIRENQLIVSILKVRLGRMIDQQTFVLTPAAGLSEAEVLSEAIQAVYSKQQENLPKELVVPLLPADHPVLAKWLGEKLGQKVHIILPERGIKKQLLLLAGKNAAEKSSLAGGSLQIKPALDGLQKLFNLKKLVRIEAYDISHLGGTATVGSMVVFWEGKPQKSQYRRFRIKTVRGIDDYAALGEVIYRRLRPRRVADKRFAENLPDLILIDGGKGQLNAVLKEAYQANVPEIKIVSIAKKEEEIFVPDESESIKLSKFSPELQLLQRVRDEAHRFAISYQASIHSRGLKAGTKISGIGPATQKKLVKAFGSLKAAQSASLTDLEKIVGKKAALIKKAAPEN